MNVLIWKVKMFKTLFENRKFRKQLKKLNAEKE